LKKKQNTEPDSNKTKCKWSNNYLYGKRNYICYKLI